MKLTAPLFLLASLVPAALSSTLVDIQADVKQISTSGDSIAVRVAAFQNGPNAFSTGVAIVNDAKTLATAVSNAVTDAKALTPCPLNEEDGPVLLSTYQVFVDSATNGLTIAANQSPIAKAVGLGLPSLCAGALGLLKTASASFADALQQCAPASVAVDLGDIRDKLDAVFDNTINQF